MFIVCNQKQLLATLTKCLPFADKRGTMPALQNALLTTKASAGGGQLQVHGTDLFLAITDYCPCQIKEAGAIALEAKALTERVRNMPDGDVSIQVTDGKATIRSVGGKRRFALATLPAEEMPKVPEAKGADWTSVPGATLAQLIAATSFSVSPDETRLHLNSLLIEINGTLIRAVSTDGHRLSKLDLQLSEPAREQSLLIPLKGITELRRLLSDGDVRLAVVGPNLFVASGDSVVSVKLVDAQFPPWSQVLPTDQPRTAKAPRVALLDAVKAVSVSAPDRTGGIKLTLANGAMCIAADGPDSGEGSDEVAVDYSGAEYSVGLNSRYLVDVLEKALTCDEVELGFGQTELDPILVNPTDGVKADFCLMPMRI